MLERFDTRTGAIFCDRENKLEFLYVGDYGKENNIKADFLGLSNKIDKVKHTDVDLKYKLVVTISTQKGCPMKCDFCDCPKVGFDGNISYDELKYEILEGIKQSNCVDTDRLNIHYARMGEPTFNGNVLTISEQLKEIINNTYPAISTIHPVVSTMLPKSNKFLKSFLLRWCDIKNSTYDGEAGLQFSINTLDEEDRNKMFNNRSLSLNEISKLSKELPTPIGRKYTLNFAVTSKSNLDVNLMNKYFDKDKFIIKITPIHETKEAILNRYEIVKKFDVYEQFEKPLVEDGWDVIVFVPSDEEDADRITCGNALLSK